jgi:hypothetical protein
MHDVSQFTMVEPISLYSVPLYSYWGTGGRVDNLDLSFISTSRDTQESRLEIF